jgi:hypothetical protein
MGLVTVEQVEKALAVQKMLAQKRRRKLIGMIMVELEMLTTTQLLSVIHTYEEEQDDPPPRQTGMRSRCVRAKA